MILLFWPIWCNSLEKKNGSANHSSLGSRQRKQNTYVCTSLIHRHRSMHFLHTNHFNFHMAVIRISPPKVIVSLFFIKSVNIIKKPLICLHVIFLQLFCTCLIFIAVWRGWGYRHVPWAWHYDPWWSISAVWWEEYEACRSSPSRLPYSSS